MSFISEQYFAHNSRIFKTTATLALAAALPGMISCKSSSKVGNSWGIKNPNIILIYTDDQGYADVGVYGATDIATPNIDKLANEGVRFTDFYVASPVCTPSRASLLTGCYPKRIGMGVGVYFPNDPKGMNPNEVTIADMLKTKNYATMCIGKWHLGRPNEVLPTAQGFDHYYGIPYSNDMTPDHFAYNDFPRLPLMEDETVIDDGENGSKGVDQTTLTAMYTDRAIQFINENKASPFFLYLAHNQPHFPNYFSDEWAGTSDRGRYGDAVQEVDWSVGEIVSALEESNLDEKTLIIFASDNGPWKFVKDMAPDAYGTWSETSDGTTGSALPLFGWKGETYEGGPRVPCIMWSPGQIPAGKVSHELATNMDILPTIADIVGIDISKNPAIDGNSIRKLLLDPENAESPTEYFIYYDKDDSDGDGYPDLRAIRDSDGYKLQILDEDGKGVNNLYYLPDDIGTTTDISIGNSEKREELQNAAAEIDAEITSGIRPEWNQKSQKRD